MPFSTKRTKCIKKQHGVVQKYRPFNTHNLRWHSAYESALEPAAGSHALVSLQLYFLLALLRHYAASQIMQPDHLQTAFLHVQ